VTGAEVEFVGGDEDGKLLVVSLAGNGRPPEVIRLPAQPMIEATRDPQGPVPLLHHVYVLEVSQRDSGPLWLYRYQETV
jgi:hypothetical protein